MSADALPNWSAKCLHASRQRKAGAIPLGACAHPVAYVLTARQVGDGFIRWARTLARLIPVVGSTSEYGSLAVTKVFQTLDDHRLTA